MSFDHWSQIASRRRIREARDKTFKETDLEKKVPTLKETRQILTKEQVSRDCQRAVTSLREKQYLRKALILVVR